LSPFSPFCASSLFWLDTFQVSFYSTPLATRLCSIFCPVAEFSSSYDHVSFIESSPPLAQFSSALNPSVQAPPQSAVFSSPFFFFFHFFFCLRRSRSLFKEGDFAFSFSLSQLGSVFYSSSFFWRAAVHSLSTTFFLILLFDLPSK